MKNAQIFEAARKSTNEQAYYAHTLAVENASFDINDRLNAEQLVEYVRHLDGVLASGVIEADGVSVIRALGV